MPTWLADGAPSLEGVGYLGTIYHQGRGAGSPSDPAFDSTEDIDFNHEAERTASGNLLLATDERGGGVLPPGAACSPASDLVAGNGGIHAYRFDALRTDPPDSPDEAFEAYARTPEGDKAIYRAPIRTQAQPNLCTAHVFHQIPGQNRIFMGWYAQGTQVVDFVERPNGTVEFREAGYFIPANANTCLGRLRLPAEPGRQLHLLGGHRRLQPRERGSQRRRHLEGDPAAAAHSGFQSCRPCPAPRVSAKKCKPKKKGKRRAARRRGPRRRRGQRRQEEEAQEEEELQAQEAQEEEDEEEVAAPGRVSGRRLFSAGP